MLSDEVLDFLDSAGYSCARLFELGVYGECCGWQCSVWHRESQRHIGEQGATPVEAVAALVARLGGRADLVPSRDTGRLEANIAARMADSWAWANLRPTP